MLWPSTTVRAVGLTVTPAASSSSIVTVTLEMSPAETAAYSLVPLTVWLRVTAGSGAASASLVGGDSHRLGRWFQSSDVKVRVSALRFRSVSVCPLTVTLTSALGCVSSTTV